MIMINKTTKINTETKDTTMSQPADQKQQQQEQPRSRYEEYQDFVAQQHAHAVETSQRSDQQARLDNAGWHTEEQ